MSLLADNALSSISMNKYMYISFAVTIFFSRAGKKVSFSDFRHMNSTFKMRENVCTHTTVYAERERRVTRERREQRMEI